MSMAVASYFWTSNATIGSWGSPSEDVCREIRHKSEGGLAGWVHRNLPFAKRAGRGADAAPVWVNVARVYATVWPVRRSPATTLYRCRVWDGVRASEAFLINAPHRFASSDQVVILAVLAAADDIARDILATAARHGVEVEFNEDKVPAEIIGAALDLLSTTDVNHPAPGRLEVLGVAVELH